MRRKIPDPCILGLDPPTKDVWFGRTRFLKGYDVVFYHARFPDGTRAGDRSKPTERGGMAAWLHFCRVSDIRSFAEKLIEFADHMEKEEAEKK